MSTVNWQVTHDRTEGIRLLQRGAAGGSPFANLAMGFRCASSAGGRARARAGLGWAGLDWAGLGWAGLGWARLGHVDVPRRCHVELEWLGLVLVGAPPISAN